MILDIIGTIIATPFFLLFGAVFGGLALFSTFGALYASSVIVLLLLSFVLLRLKKESLSLFLLASTFLYSWLLYFSWPLSRRLIDAEEAVYTWGMDLPSVATAGFPIKTLEIPPSPMGSNVIPVEMWERIFLNQAFWLLVAFFVTYIFRERIMKWVSLHRKWIGVFSFLPVLATLFLFALWFD